MILLPRAVRVYFATQPTNLRLSFEGLTNQIRHALGYDPLNGHVFVFLNRRRDQTTFRIRFTSRRRALPMAPTARKATASRADRRAR